ncbi:MAG: pyridoxal phosphate-dependent aminotransferase [Bryobacteraceae bacterium]|nr:pyridoxal phosphate-dependent aminotransferase [Bryobacteraceae bacterium]
MQPRTKAAPALADRVSLISMSATMKVSAEAARLKREGIDVVGFGAGEPDFPTPEHIKRAGIKAIEDNFTKYTQTGGVPELKSAICDNHARDYGTAYKASECMVNVGGKHTIFNFTQALLNPGDEVVIPIPYWVTYKDVVNYTGARCVFVDTDEDKGFTVTAAMIERHLNPKTKMVIINSPSNPSGAVVEDDEFKKILELTADHGVWLMTDECYDKFVYSGQPFSIAGMPGAKENVLVVGSLSKTYSMTGWRIGFGLAPAPVIKACEELQSHSTSNPTSIAQKAAIEALRGPQDDVGSMLAEYRRRRDYVIDRIQTIPGMKMAEPKGAFYAYPNVSGVFGRDGINSAMDFTEKLLQKAHVAVVPGEAFGTDKHIRISYATSMKELERGLDRIHKYVDSLLQ